MLNAITIIFSSLDIIFGHQNKEGTFTAPNCDFRLHQLMFVDDVVSHIKISYALVIAQQPLRKSILRKQLPY